MSAAEPLPPLDLEPGPMSEGDLESLLASALEDIDEAGVDATGEIVVELVGRSQPWTVTDTGSAEWAMRRYAEAAAQLAAIDAQHHEWLARVEEWRRRAARPLEARLAYFGFHLESFQAARRAADQRAKTLSLPSGEVRTTSYQAKVVVENPGVVVLWAESAGHVDVLKREVRLSELRSHAEIVEVFDVWMDVRLYCGHVASRCVAVGPVDEADPEYQTFVETELTVARERASWACEECNTDPGAAVTVGTRRVGRLIAVDPESNVQIPGVTVEPAGFTVKVRPIL